MECLRQSKHRPVRPNTGWSEFDEKLLQRLVPRARSLDRKKARVGNSAKHNLRRGLLILDSSVSPIQGSTAGRFIVPLAGNIPTVGTSLFSYGALTLRSVVTVQLNATKYRSKNASTEHQKAGLPSSTWLHQVGPDQPERNPRSRRRCVTHRVPVLLRFPRVNIK
jgi:hypothetical protein